MGTAFQYVTVKDPVVPGVRVAGMVVVMYKSEVGTGTAVPFKATVFVPAPVPTDKMPVLAPTTKGL